MTSEKLFPGFRKSRNQISREISLQNSHECGNNNPWRGISNSKARRRAEGYEDPFRVSLSFAIIRKGDRFWLNVS